MDPQQPNQGQGGNNPQQPQQQPQPANPADQVQEAQLPVSAPQAQEPPKATNQPPTSTQPTSTAPAPVDIGEKAQFVPGSISPKIPHVSIKFVAVAIIAVFSTLGVLWYFRTLGRVVEKQVATTSRLVSKIELESVYSNPFEEESQYVNPFSEYKSPFYQLQ